MRRVTIDYTEDGFDIQDSDEQFVFVSIEGDIAYFVSKLHFDDTAVSGSCHKDDAMGEALRLLGVLD